MPGALDCNGEVCYSCSEFLDEKLTVSTCAQFLIPWARVGKCRAELYDDSLTEKLWNWLEAEVKPYET